MTPNHDRTNLRPPAWADVEYPDRATRATRAARHRVRARRAEKRRDNLVITLACIALLLALWALLLAADARTLALVGIHQAGA